MSTDNRALTGRALVKNFGNVHALAGVDIDIPSGQALAIMGPSGSGKSTLLHCLSGILTPTSGEICLGGKNVSRIHWDIVKDLRLPGSRIELDGDVVQRDGAWAI